MKILDCLRKYLYFMLIIVIILCFDKKFTLKKYLFFVRHKFWQCCCWRFTLEMWHCVIRRAVPNVLKDFSAFVLRNTQSRISSWTLRQHYSSTYQKPGVCNICPPCSDPHLLLVDSFVLVRKLSAWNTMHVTKLVIW